MPSSCLDVKGLHVYHSRAKLFLDSELAPQVALHHLAVGKLEYQLVCLDIEQFRKHPGISALTSRPAPKIPKADVQREFGVDALYAGIIKLHPIFHRARDNRERRVVDLDEVSARFNQGVKLVVYDARELLG